MEGFLLGVSNGVICVAYCTPVLVPCLLAGGGGLSRSTAVTLRFLGGRLLGYLLFGVVAWAIGRPLLQAAGYRELITGSVYMVLSVMLVLFGFFNDSHSCSAPAVTSLVLKPLGRIRLSALVPEAAGLATGLNLCPPFLLALAASVEKGSLSSSLFFFLMFFIGTALFFIPAPFLGLLKTVPAFRTVGKLAAGLIGLYYFYSGLIMFVGGIKSV